MAAYQRLFQSGKLRERLEAAVSLLESCSVCPRHCAVNRLAGDAGECCTSREAMVFSYGPHFGEEAPLVGRYGSGTVFSLIVTSDVCSARMLLLARWVRVRK